MAPKLLYLIKIVLLQETIATLLDDWFLNYL